jgi:hypothetical protein
MTVNDAAYAGALNNVVFTVIAGTAAASPTAPATPANSISLATIAVAAAATTITSGNITDTRVAATSTLINALALPITGGTLTGNVRLVAGSASVAPLRLTSGTLLTSGTIGGAVEYDGNVTYLNPNSTATLTSAGGRGLIPASFYFALNADRTLTAGTGGTFSLFGVGITLAAATTYEIEINGQTNITFSSATSNQISLTSTGLTMAGNLLGGVTGGAPVLNNLVGGSATLYTSTTASTKLAPFQLKALIRNTGGAATFTPSITLSASNTTLVQLLQSSWIKVTPIGNGTVTTVGAWA